VLEVDGWRMGLSICRDTGAAQHTVGTAALGIDVYVAGLVHRPEELAEQEARAVVIARTCRSYVVFASFAGPTGDVFSETAGCSAIWSPDGRAVARTGPDIENTAAATLTWAGTGLRLPGRRSPMEHPPVDCRSALSDAATGSAYGQRRVGAFS